MNIGPDFRSISRVDYKGLLRPAAPPTPSAAATSPPAASPKDGGRPGRTRKVRVDRRRFRGLARARDILDSLPEVGESLHCILYGYFDLCHLLLVLLDKLAPTVCARLRVATLSLSLKNIGELCQLIDKGTVKRLGVLSSDFQAKHDEAIYTTLLDEVSIKRGQKVAAARNHCKLILLDMEDGSKWTMEGSASLRTSRNSENLAICQSPEVFGFYREWFDEVMSKHVVRGEVDR